VHSAVDVKSTIPGSDGVTRDNPNGPQFDQAKERDRPYQESGRNFNGRIARIHGFS
jgi:hypothetical protein